MIKILCKEGRKMPNPNIDQEITQIVAEIIEVETEKLTPTAKFVEDLGVDSMMALEMLAALEKKYKIVVPEDSLPKFTNLGEVIRMVEELLAKKQGKK